MDKEDKFERRIYIDILNKDKDKLNRIYTNYTLPKGHIITAVDFNQMGGLILDHCSQEYILEMKEIREEK